MFKSKRESIIVLVWMVVLLAFTLIKVTIPALTEDLDPVEVAVVAEQPTAEPSTTSQASEEVIVDSPVVADATSNEVEQVTTEADHTNDSQESPAVDEVEGDEQDAVAELEQIMESCELCLNNVVHGHSN